VDWDDYDDDRQEPAQPSAEQRELEVLRTRNRYLEGRVSELEAAQPKPAEQLSLEERIAAAEREGRWSDSMRLKGEYARGLNPSYAAAVARQSAPAAEPVSLEDLDQAIADAEQAGDWSLSLALKGQLAGRLHQEMGRVQSYPRGA
jgi:hypothetical protein